MTKTGLSAQNPVNERYGDVSPTVVVACLYGKAMTPDHSNGTNAQHTGGSKGWVITLGLIAGSVWGVMAGGGGLWLLFTKGLWPLTNGWFALASGISGCPLTAWVLKRCTGITVSGRTQFAFALLFFIAGRIALKVGI